ncbi:integral membrane protein S linking to the trans Golgi network-domain-containing protein, partial [Geranomyces variabilis]
SSFRASKFDPILLSAQIVALQCTYYLTASLQIFLLELLTGSPITLAHVLSPSELRTDTVLGWALSLGMLLNAGAAAYALVILVGRSRLCVDFSVTLHFLHLLATSAYSRGVPRNLWWWVVMMLSMVGVAVGGEKLCLRKEMEPIEL